jgi:hypothetical protein
MRRNRVRLGGIDVCRSDQREQYEPGGEEQRGQQQRLVNRGGQPAR